MSSKDTARRASVRVIFQGADITKDIRPYLLTATYTDNEEDETDDLQIKLQDRDGIWVQKWLADVINAAGSKDAAAAPVSAAAPSSDWSVGDEVIANGRGYYSSYGALPRSIELKNYEGKVSYVNPGAPYPVAVGQIGWFGLDQVQHKGQQASEPLPIEKKGFAIEAVIVQENWYGGGKDKLLDCGLFELDSVDASGPPNVITIKASSLPYSSQIRQTEKSKAWEAYKLSGIAAEMAKQNGMECMYLSSADPYYARTEQFKQSDISFLSSLCHDAGISLKVTNNIIVLFDQAAYEAKGAVLTLKRAGGGYIKYKISSGKADKEYSSCRVSYNDPSTGKCIEGIAKVEDYNAKSKTNQQLEVTAKVASVAEAKAKAEKLLRLHNKFEKTASFTLPGNPSLVAGLTVQLDGWGAWSGKYIISQSKHSIGNNGYTTQIALRKVLEGY